MTIPEKKRRKIVVDGSTYHWTPGIKPDGRVTIQHSSGKGAYLIIDLFVDTTPLFPIMKPADVEEAIRFAIAAGWNPGKEGCIVKLGFRQLAPPPDRLSILAK